MWLPSAGHVALAGFVASALYVHFRGRDRFPIVRALTSYMVLLAPYNALMYLFSRVPAKAYLDVADFPELAPLARNWETIRDEALRLAEDGAIRAATGYNDIGFNSFFRTGWKRFYLKWYGVEQPSARAACPRTVALLDAIPSVKAAMFASLPPGARLVRHRDPFAGSVRYHLGLATPNDERCFIVVDGERYAWRDGEPVMFDETFIHYAENQTDRQRIILFCDVDRPLTSRLLARFNRWFGAHVMRASATENVPGEEVGFVNRVFAQFYRLRLWAKALKAKSRPAYYTLKWVIVGGLVWLVFV